MLPVQRAYTAPCPGCGAPVAFQSAQSTHAVCGFCRSMVVRQGETLARLGKAAEVFVDHSPLQLQVRGRWRGQGFALVGRLQLKSPNGAWNEWLALFDDGSQAWLSEDNGAYVFSVPVHSLAPLPDAAHLRLGAQSVLNGERCTVTSRARALLLTAQGELSRLPPTETDFEVVELRSEQGAVFSIELSDGLPVISRGEAVQLEALALSGLREDNAKVEQGRQFNCPNCGTTLSLQHEQSKTLTCSACKTVIDVSQGIGGELHHALQDEPVKPLIQLGQIGQLQGAAWQVVGFLHRVGQTPEDPDEQFGWEEYLLFNRERGFMFLVDATDGWSLLRPVTGAPKLEEGGRVAHYRAQRYGLKELYTASTDWVEGEFYWPVRRDQISYNSDFVAQNNVLNLERSGDEIVWSIGARIASESIAKAFNLQDRGQLMKRADAAPWSSRGDYQTWMVLLGFIGIVLLLGLLRGCQECDPAIEDCPSDRTSGARYGGYSSGGWHK